MQVFISWSGNRSRDVAAALRDWLPGVINSVEPFVSSEDVYAGSRWQTEINDQLDQTNFGIVCVTAANQREPWLHFEAGALAKAVDISRVVPLAIDLKPSDVQPPLGQFQAQPLTQGGIAALIKSLNAADPKPLSELQLDKALRVWWPELEKALAALEPSDADESRSAHVRSDRDLLEEVLDMVRGLARTEAPRDTPPTNPLPLPMKGTQVVHRAFGSGVVLRVEPREGIVVVRFEADGSERKLMWAYAPLKLASF